MGANNLALAKLSFRLILQYSTILQRRRLAKQTKRGAPVAKYWLYLFARDVSRLNYLITSQNFLVQVENMYVSLALIAHKLRL